MVDCGGGSGVQGGASHADGPGGRAGRWGWHMQTVKPGIVALAVVLCCCCCCCCTHAGATAFGLLCNGSIACNVGTECLVRRLNDSALECACLAVAEPPPPESASTASNVTCETVSSCGGGGSRWCVAAANGACQDQPAGLSGFQCSSEGSGSASSSSNVSAFVVVMGVVCVLVLLLTIALYSMFFYTNSKRRARMQTHTRGRTRGEQQSASLPSSNEDDPHNEQLLTPSQQSSSVWTGTGSGAWPLHSHLTRGLPLNFPRQTSVVRPFRAPTPTGNEGSVAGTSLDMERSQGERYGFSCSDSDGESGGGLSADTDTDSLIVDLKMFNELQRPINPMGDALALGESDYSNNDDDDGVTVCTREHCHDADFDAIAWEGGGSDNEGDGGEGGFAHVWGTGRAHINPNSVNLSLDHNQAAKGGSPGSGCLNDTAATAMTTLSRDHNRNSNAGSPTSPGALPQQPPPPPMAGSTVGGVWGDSNEGCGERDDVASAAAEGGQRAEGVHMAAKGTERAPTQPGIRVTRRVVQPAPVVQPCAQHENYLHTPTSEGHTPSHSPQEVIAVIDSEEPPAFMGRQRSPNNAVGALHTVQLFGDIDPPARGTAAGEGGEDGDCGDGGEEDDELRRSAALHQLRAVMARTAQLSKKAARASSLVASTRHSRFQHTAAATASATSPTFTSGPGVGGGRRGPFVGAVPAHRVRGRPLLPSSVSTDPDNPVSYL